jgi:hypothetical protein
MFNSLAVIVEHCKLRVYVQYFGTLVEYFGTLVLKQLAKLAVQVPPQFRNELRNI